MSTASASGTQRDVQDQFAANAIAWSTLAGSLLGQRAADDDAGAAWLATTTELRRPGVKRRGAAAGMPNLWHTLRCTNVWRLG